jgi:hypothetical protein
MVSLTYAKSEENGRTIRYSGKWLRVCVEDREQKAGGIVVRHVTGHKFVVHPSSSML